MKSEFVVCSRYHPLAKWFDNLTFYFQRYNGKTKGEKIYLSIIGEVYDVSNGGAKFYAEGTGYHGFAGRDAAVPFVNLKFTEEEAAKSTDVLKDSELQGLKTWVDFYKNEERYLYMGRLVGRYYDSEGNPTEEMQKVLTRWENYVPPPPRKRRKPKEGRKAKAKN